MRCIIIFSFFILFTFASFFFIDPAVYQLISDFNQQYAFHHTFFAYVTLLGEKSYILPLVLVALVSDYLYKRQNVLDMQGRLYLFLVAQTMFVMSVITISLKFIVSRMRPIYGDSFAFDPLSYADINNSFPSGHTQIIFTLIIVLLCIRQRHILFDSIALATAIMVGVSRLVLNQHYFTDIFVSALLTSFIAYQIVQYHLKRPQLLGFIQEYDIRNYVKALIVCPASSDHEKKS